MNYHKIYGDLINKSKNRIFLVDVYTEKHHISPRCIGGTNEKENIAILLPREHFIAHLLLYKMYPNNRKLLYAFNMMCNLKKYGTMNNRLYEHIRIEYNKINPFRLMDKSGQKNPMYNKKVFDIWVEKYGLDIALLKREELTKKRIENRRGYSHTEETRNKISMSQKGKIITEESKQKISQTLKGRTWEDINGEDHTKKRKESLLKRLLGVSKTEEQKKKTSETLKGHSVLKETRKKISDTLKNKKFLKIHNKKFNLSLFTNGWIFGDFFPSLFKNKEFEIGVKHYKKGDKEQRHLHKIATEYTVILQGKVRMNKEILLEKEIIVIEPGESTDFEALEDTITLVIKTPSITNDKFEDFD